MERRGSWEKEMQRRMWRMDCPALKRPSLDDMTKPEGAMLLVALVGVAVAPALPRSAKISRPDVLSLRGE
jgi:hypothetical protein